MENLHQSQTLSHNSHTHTQTHIKFQWIRYASDESFWHCFFAYNMTVLFLHVILQNVNAQFD